MTTRRVGTIDWGRAIERLCFLFPPVVGVGLIGVIREAGIGIALLDQGLFLVGTFGYTLLTIALTIALVCDIRRVRRRGGASGHWKPNPWLNAVFALLWAPVAGVFYLYRRHKRFGTKPGGSSWWLVVAISLFATLVSATGAVIAVVFALPTLLVTSIALAGTIAFGVFPVAIHQDAAYVLTDSDGWRPNPGLYLGLAFLGLSIPPLQPIVAGYYLTRRYRAIGLS